MRKMTPEQVLNPEDQDQRILVALIDFIKDEFAGINTNMEAMKFIMSVINRLTTEERKTKSRVDLLLLVSRKIHDLVATEKEQKKKQRERELYADSVEKCLDLGAMIGGLPVKGDKSPYEEVLVVGGSKNDELENFLNLIKPSDLTEN